MSVNIQAWEDSHRLFEEQVEKFNKKLQINSIDFDTEEFKDIYKIVKEEVEELKRFAKEAERQEKALNRPGCCAPTSKAMWVLSLLNGASKVCVVAGIILAAFDEAIWPGIGVAVGAELFDSVTTIYSNKLFFKGMVITELSKINKQGVENAQIFKNFLKELKKVKKLEKKLLEQSKNHEKTTLNDHVVIEIHPTEIPKSLLDDQISSCIHCYERLPSNYQSDEAYCRMISIFIQSRPFDDELKRGLTHFEPLETSDLSILADKPLPIQYLPNLRRKRPSLPHEQNHWSHEQASKENLFSEEVKPEDIEYEYVRNLAYYKDLVAKRFKTKHNIAFFEINGWHIDEKGITKIKENREASSSQSDKKQTSPKLKEKVVATECMV